MLRNLWIVIAALFAIAAPAADSPKTYPPRRFVVEFTAAAPGAEQAFQAAIGHDGRLELIEATTPFRKELSAASLTIN